MFKPVVTGIDFTDSTLSTATVRQTGAQLHLIGAGQYKLTSAPFSDNFLSHHQEIVNMLAKIKRQQPLFQHKVALAIPDTVVMSRTIKLDAVIPVRQQNLMAKHHFCQKSPVAAEHLLFDFLPVEGGVRVFAAKRQMVESRVALVKRSGMRVISVSSEHQALAQMLARIHAECGADNRVLLELNGSSLNLVASLDGQMFYHTQALINPSDHELLSQVIEQLIDDYHLRQHVKQLFITGLLAAPFHLTSFCSLPFVKVRSDQLFDQVASVSVPFEGVARASAIAICGLDAWKFGYAA